MRALTRSSWRVDFPSPVVGMSRQGTTVSRTAVLCTEPSTEASFFSAAHWVTGTEHGSGLPKRGPYNVPIGVVHNNGKRSRFPEPPVALWYGVCSLDRPRDTLDKLYVDRFPVECGSCIQWLKIKSLHMNVVQMVIPCSVTKACCLASTGAHLVRTYNADGDPCAEPLRLASPALRSQATLMTDAAYAICPPAC